MTLTDILLAFAPLSLLLTGILLFAFGSRLNSQSRALFMVVVVVALSAFLSQVALGIGFARPAGIRTPEISLYRWSPVGDAGFGVTVSFRADLLAYLFALPLSALTLLTVFYLMVRRPYAESQDNIAAGRLYGLIFLAEGAGLGAFYSSDLILTCFWLEAVGFILYLLSGPGLRGASAKPSSYQAFAVNFFAGQLIFAPILVIVSRNGGGSEYADLVPAVLDGTLFGVLLLGCLIKAAQFPFQAWLGNFEDLPGAVYALLMAGFIFPFAIYLPIRLQALAIERQNLLDSVDTLLLPLGSLTILCASFTALRASRLSTKIGLLAAAQFGFVTISLGLNDLTAAFQQLISLVIGTALLFLATDQLEIENAPPPNPDNRSKPAPLGRPPAFRAILIGIYLVGALNFAGLPFSPVYAARWRTLDALLTSNYRFFFGLIIIGLIITLPSLIQILISFLNGPRRTADAYDQERFWVILTPLILAILSIVLGFYPALTNAWLNSAIGRIQPNREIIALEGLVAGGWLGILAAVGLVAGFAVYWFGQPRLAFQTPYNGGLVYGPVDPNKPQHARPGRSKMALKVVEKEEELPEGFDDDFFSGAFKKNAEQKQAARRILPDPRQSNVDYFGGLNNSLREIYKLVDTAYAGGFFARLLLRLLTDVRRVFEWTIERFYPALTVFVFIVIFILLTR